MESGACTVDGSAMCFRSPNYPSNYGNYESCTITVIAHEAVTLSVVAFSVEAESSCGYDSLTVNGNTFCGTSGPDGVQVAAGATIIFMSDDQITSTGFEICGTSPARFESMRATLSCCPVCRAKPHLGVSRASSSRITQCGGVNRSKPASISISPSSSSFSVASSDSSVPSWCVNRER